jgi:chromate transporter
MWVGYLRAAARSGAGRGGGVHRPLVPDRGRGRRAVCPLHRTAGGAVAFLRDRARRDAIITIAAVKLLRLTDRRDWRLWLVSAVVFTVTAGSGSEPVPLIIAAGLVLIALDARPVLC